MDTYLEIAEKVLRVTKRPMSARSILDAAYQSEIVPVHLYGKTQHKTLQARLSEDILRLRNNSKFFRTEPGVFFLAALVADSSISNRYKLPFSARRRKRDLVTEPVLAVRSDFLDLHSKAALNWHDFARRAGAANAFKFVDAKRSSDGYDLVWAFSIVRRSRCALSYRVGKYRDDFEVYANKRTIGFTGLISVNDQTLFSMDDYGAAESSLQAVLFDLDLSRETFGEASRHPRSSNVISVKEHARGRSLLVVMEWDCPAWFEPTTRRLSLNEPMWWDITVSPNDRDDFEDWSLAAMDLLFAERQNYSEL